MPAYEYQCAKCGTVLEVLEKAGSNKRHKCPKCGSTRMVKLLSTFGVGKGSTTSTGSCSTGTCPTGTCSLS